MNIKKVEHGSAATVKGRAKADPVGCRVSQLVNRAVERLLLTSPRGLVVAYSGGVDSRVLLECVNDWCRLHQSHSGAALPLRAHHINHGLQSGSDDWAMQCDTICRQLQIGFTISQVSVDLLSGLSPEDAARRARYNALKEDLRAGEVLLTAHHADDQAETLLLQLFRGAGVNGLAAMPEYAAFGNGHLARPMLQVAGDAVREFAMSRNLKWIDDPSNDDNSFDRNLLRNQLMPLLRGRWPSITRSISRSALHCAEAAEVNRLYASGILGAQGNSRDLSIALLARYSHIEKKVFLRTWIERHGFTMPSARKLDHLITDLLDASDHSAGKLSWGNACVRRYRHHLYLGALSEFEDCQSFCYRWPDLQQPLTIHETGQVLSRQDIPDTHCGADNGFVVRSRQGGEQIQLSGHRHHKSLKNLFQECAIPPWQRDRLPFIYNGDKLIGIVGIGFTD